MAINKRKNLNVIIFIVIIVIMSIIGIVALVLNNIFNRYQK